ncbi:hypothetical protein [Pseudomonas graminis]
MSYLSEVMNKVDFDDDIEIKELFFTFNVSKFDHYLTPDEYSNEDLICYSDIKNDPLKEKYFNSINSQFLKLYSGLHGLSNGNISLLIDGVIQEDVSDREYNSALSNAMKEKPLCGFLFSNLGLYVMTGYDLTHSFYMLKNKVHLLGNINDMIKNSGLFILDL